MKYQATATFLALTALFVGAGASGFAASIPGTIQNVESPGGPPAWISEEALRTAMEDSGQPVGSRLESVGYLFAHWERLSWALEDYAEVKDFEIAPDGTLASCEPQVLTYYHDERAKDLKGLLELSAAVSSVRVVDSRPGFRFGQPGELLEVEVLSILKDTGKTPLPRDNFFLFDRYTRMVIDGRPLCLGDRRVPMGQFLLFQIHTELPATLGGVPTFFMDGSALISIDGAFYGALLDHAVDPKQLAQQFSALDQLLHSEEQR